MRAIEIKRRFQYDKDNPYSFFAEIASRVPARGRQARKMEEEKMQRRSAYEEITGHPYEALSDAVQMARGKGFGPVEAQGEADWKLKTPDERLRAARMTAGGGWLPETVEELGNGNYWQALGHAIASGGTAPNIADFLPRVDAGPGIHSDFSQTAEMANLKGSDYNTMATAMGNVSDSDLMERDQLLNAASRTKDPATLEAILGLLNQNPYEKAIGSGREIYGRRAGREEDEYRGRGRAGYYINWDALLGAYR